MNTPESLYNHLRGAVSNPDEVVKMVRVMFPGWEPAPPVKKSRNSRFKRAHVKSLISPDEPGINQAAWFEDGVIEGSEALADALESGRGPDRFLWAIKTAPNEGTSKMIRESEAVARLKAERDFVASLYVSRDPCPYCGTRGDLGCRHRQAAA